MRKKTLFTFSNLLFFHLNKLESLSPKDALCQVWLKLAQWFCMEKKMQVWTVYDNDDNDNNDNDNDEQRTNFDQKSSPGP